MRDLEERLRELAEKATPGPWRWNPTGSDPNSPRMFLEACGRDWRHVLKISWPKLLGEADAEYLAAVDPTTVLALLRRLSELEQENERLRNTLRATGCPRRSL